MDCCWLARRLYWQQNRQQTGEGIFLDIILGLVGGYIFNLFGGSGVTGFNLPNLTNLTSP
jgi:uncharacterized membrane protein YeaQ/YmgE (transglycosylase-associated protein family)